MPNYRPYLKYLCPNLINLDSKFFSSVEVKRSLDLFSGRLTNEMIQLRLKQKKVRNVLKLNLGNYGLNHYSNELNLR